MKKNYANHLKVLEDLSLFIITANGYYEVVKNQDNIQNLSSLNFTVVSEKEFETLEGLPKGIKHLVLDLNKAS